jgi:LuxR family maltose regulon positive regulatory protein
VFLLRLASALAAQNPPVTLAVDDLHLLTEPQLLDGLDFVLRNVGTGLRLVAVSRTDPLLPLYRYRLAGELAEIGASDLAFSTAEAGLLKAQHGSKLPADSLERLTRRTEGWAAGLRLAAISMDTHRDPDQFVTELITEDSALTSYLVEEVLNTQPPQVREVLLATSILEQVSADAASELAGNEQAARILPALAHANAFVQPAGHGWYRYHPLLAEVLRLKLRREYPDRVATLHRRAARWYERNGSLTDAVRHAAQAGDWQLAAGMVIGGLAISEIIEPRDSPSLAGEFRGMPHSGAWTGPQPHLISAAAALSAGRPESSLAALDVAEGILARLPADQEAAGRLAAAMIRLAAARRTGDLVAGGGAAAHAEALVSMVPDDGLARREALPGAEQAGLHEDPQRLPGLVVVVHLGDLADSVALGVDSDAADVIPRVLRGGHSCLHYYRMSRMRTSGPRDEVQGTPSYPARTATNSASAELRITRVFSCVARGFKARVSFGFSECGWR